MQKNSKCPVTATLDLIGGKYKPMILWHLSSGTLRFTELRRLMKEATPKMLTQQLREMEAQSLIHREVYAVVPPRVEYSLTELGRSLLPIMEAMRSWGDNYLKTHSTDANCFKTGSEAASQST